MIKKFLYAALICLATTGVKADFTEMFLNSFEAKISEKNIPEKYDSQWKPTGHAKEVKSKIILLFKQVNLKDKDFSNINQIISLIPNEPEGYLLRAIKHIALKNYSDALNDLDNVIDIGYYRFFTAEAYLLKAEIHKNLGEVIERMICTRLAANYGSKKAEEIIALWEITEFKDFG